MNCKCENFKPRTTTNLIREIVTCKNCGRTEPVGKAAIRAIDEFNDKPLQPVFTQKMADAGELPSVDVECFFHHSNWQPLDFERGYLLASTDEYIIYKLNSNASEQSCRRKLMSFSPLTPLINGRPYEFTFGSFTTVAYYDEGISSFNNQLATYYAKHCTNIKLLEVKS